MSKDARPWLPEAALYDGVLAGAFEQAASHWAAEWFVNPPSVAIRISANANPDGVEALSVLAAPGLRLVLDEKAAQAMGRTLLQLPGSARAITQADTALFRNLGSRCARDFLASAAQTARDLTHLSSESVQAPIRIAVSVERAAFSLCLDRAVAIHMRKALAKPEPRTGELRARREAIAAQTIRLGALVGASQLTLGELHSLEHGDVIVLDRGPTDALPISVNGIAGDVPACALFSEQERLMLRLHEPEKTP